MEDKKIKLIYDIITCPNGIEIDAIFEIIKNSGIVFYDSFKGNPPEIVSNDLKAIDVKFYTKKELSNKIKELTENT